MKKYKILIITMLAFTSIMLMGCEGQSTATYQGLDKKAEDNETAQDVGKVGSSAPTKTEAETGKKLGAEKKAELEAKVDSYLKDFQGAVLIAKDDNIVLAKGYGYADEENKIRNTENTTFEIGSITKQFTAAAIMQLVEQGKLSVDDTIEKYFPDYPQGKKITIKNLLQMRSGIYDFLNEVDHFFQYADVDANDINSIQLLNRDFLLENLYKLKLAFQPDSKYSYSNTNYFLLGLIIEQVSGMSYEEYIKKNIFDVCKMNSNIKYQGSDAKGYNQLCGYVSYPVEACCSVGSINASVMDLYRWNEALFDGKIVSKKSLSEMTASVEGYGYGLYNNLSGTIFHSGATICFAGYNSYNIYEKVQVILLSNNIYDENNRRISFNKLVLKIKLSIRELYE